MFFDEISKNYSVTTDKCLKFMAFPGVILYSVQSFLSPEQT